MPSTLISHFRGGLLLTAMTSILMLLSMSAKASIVTETPEQLYSLSESELFRMLQQQNMTFNGMNFDELSMPLGLKQQVGDEKALAFIGQLLSAGDSRGPTALANYIQRYPNDLLGFHLAATELIKQKKFKEAELTLEKILREYPDYHSATNLLGLIRISQQQYSLAAQLFARVLLRDEKPNGMAARYMAWLGMRQGNVSQAETALRMTMANMPQPITSASPLLLELAELLRRQEKHAEVVELLANVDSSATDDPIALEALSRRFEAATNAGFTEQADLFLQPLKSTPAIESFPVIMGQARLQSQKNNTQQALSFIEKAKAQSKGFEAVRLLEKAKILAVAQQKDDAQRVLERYLTIDDETTLIQWKNYAELMIMLGKGNVAISKINNAITESDSVDLRLLLIDSLVNAGDVSGGTRELDKLLAQRPNLSPALYRKGIIQFDLGDNDAAATSFRSAVKNTPQDIAAWLALFGALHDHRVHNHAAGMAAADHKDLMPLFDEALAANPNSALLYYEKGLTAYSGSELAIAKAAFDQAVVIAPFDVPALAMASIVRSDIDEKGPESLALAQRGERLAPTNPAVLDAVGWALVQSQRIDDAIIYLDRALEIMPNDEAVLAHLAKAYRIKGDTVKSLEYVYAALKGTLPDHIDSHLRQQLVTLKPLDELQLKVSLINAFGVADTIGNITITEISDGVLVNANVEGLPTGLNGLHFHEKPSCEAAIVDGQRMAGHAAGGHYGHGHMMDMGAMDMGNMSAADHAMHMKMMKPKGDLPPLPIGCDGRASDTVKGVDLTIAELRGRSLMIHEGPDVDGVSGPKIACAVIP
ncbi:tetratricopeptide repeat protein [Alteromonas oceanisediminis]|uniref:tetratricopeptide repeat protein n=1 Tax=Alteromonas oceanisediminis TaxID=2836180 RepID=UPI001BD9E393|nr:tetratricopeptide repeat protein [Alteromonas oceanisediminis]MBT0587046.1 tetratricopeptide repeat protein [Alteromonas oceanisediminis]